MAKIPKIIEKFHVGFHLKDVLQVLIGASILAIPVGFTEEVWELGRSLPMLNVIFLVLVSLTFISAFSYYHYYRTKMAEHRWKFVKRTLLTYILSFLVVTVLLMTIEAAPWATDAILAFKRTAIVTFPASMSAAVADTIK